MNEAGYAAHELNLFHWPGGIACNDKTSGHGSNDHCSHADLGARADCNALSKKSACTNPTIGADCHSAIEADA